jgi:[acyl-carrier-protein] S-malonyltransferase
LKPRIPVISNVDAMPHSDPAVIKALLAKQVTAPVQWETTVNRLIERGMTSGYELGPGKVLAGVIKRINKDIVITNIEV